MKIPRHSYGIDRGFSLIELILAMGISLVLLAALSAIFAQSITAREKIDREGQKTKPRAIH
jgi:prepilin-type N-terminal cleavage/methylation domain-containing protein